MHECASELVRGEHDHAQLHIFHQVSGLSSQEAVPPLGSWGAKALLGRGGPQSHAAGAVVFAIMGFGIPDPVSHVP